MTLAIGVQIETCFVQSYFVTNSGNCILQSTLMTLVHMHITASYHG